MHNNARNQGSGVGPRGARQAKANANAKPSNARKTPTLLDAGADLLGARSELGADLLGAPSELGARGLERFL